MGSSSQDNLPFFLSVHSPALFMANSWVFYPDVGRRSFTRELPQFVGFHGPAARGADKLSAFSRRDTVTVATVTAAPSLRLARTDDGVGHETGSGALSADWAV